MKIGNIFPVILAGLLFSCGTKQHEETENVVETVEVDSLMLELKARDVLKYSSGTVRHFDEDLKHETMFVPILRHQVNLKMTKGGKVEGERIRTQYHWGRTAIDDSIVYLQPFKGEWTETEVYQGGSMGNGKKIKLYEIRTEEFPEEVWWLREDHNYLFAYPGHYNYVYALDNNPDRAFKVYDYKKY